MKQEKFKPDTKSHVNISKQGKNMQFFFLKDKIAAGRNTLSKKQDLWLSIFIAVCVVILVILFTVAFILNSKTPLIGFAFSAMRGVLKFG